LTLLSVPMATPSSDLELLPDVLGYYGWEILVKFA
jgi:hypothetical protein